MKPFLALATCALLAAAVPVPEIAPAHPVNAEISALAWSPDGKLLALGAYRQVRLVDSATSKVTALLNGPVEQVRSLAFSPNGKRVAAAGGLAARSGEVKVFDLDIQKELFTIKGHSDCIYSVAYSPDGKTIATASYDKLIYFWDAETGKQIRRLKDHIDAFYSISFTPD